MAGGGYKKGEPLAVNRVIICVAFMTKMIIIIIITITNIMDIIGQY